MISYPRHILSWNTTRTRSKPWVLFLKIHPFPPYAILSICLGFFTLFLLSNLLIDAVPSFPTQQGLQLTQLTLSHDKFIQESNQRIRELEAEIEELQAQRRAVAVVVTPSNRISDTPQPPTKSRWSFWWMKPAQWYASPLILSSSCVYQIRKVNKN